MSVAYQSWEVSSGPTMGFNMAIQSKSNMCSMTDILPPDVSSYNSSNLGSIGSSESFMKALVGGSTDLSNGLILPGPKVLMPHDNVTRGFSSLSLHSSKEFEASVTKNVDLNWLSANEKTVQNSTCHSAELHMQEGAPGFSSMTHVGLDKNCKPLSSRFNTVPKGTAIAMTTFPDRARLYNTKTKLHVVVEEKPVENDFTASVCNDFSNEELEADSVSSSSTCSTFSSLHDMPVDGLSTSGDGSSSNGEGEVESEYRGLFSSSLGTSPPKKGLSRFYSGKSRSFSCLADVVSIKDLSKPENPYAKKRKCLVGRSSNGRPQLPPLQKGVSSISKKSPNNGKSTLALAVAMSTKNDAMDRTREMDFQGLGKVPNTLLASRSFSFSDLQGVVGRCISPS